MTKTTINLWYRVRKKFRMQWQDIIKFIMLGQKKMYIYDIEQAGIYHFDRKKNYQ